MDFSFSDEQDALAGLAAQIFAGEVTVERIRAVEEAGAPDDALWTTLAEAGLLGVGVGESAGGTGGGAIEAGRVLEEQGRTLAPVPLAHALVAAAALDRFGGSTHGALLADAVAGEALVVVGLDQPAGSTWDAPATVAARSGDAWLLGGWVPCVPALGAARAVIVPARLDGTADVGLFLVDPHDARATIDPVELTSRQPAGHLSLHGCPAAALGEPELASVRWVAERLMLALSAVTLGVAEEALRRAAEYTSQRQQFGQPLSAFQSTAHKAADAYIDVEAIRATLWQAAWLFDGGAEDAAEASAAVLVARWWAEQAGQRVVHAVQHMHGGIGADVEYPVHRFFLWAKQLELSLGSPTEALARLGTVIAEQARNRAPVAPATPTEEAAR